MTRFLFWNINKKRLIKEIVSLSHENEVDVLILAEAKPDISDNEIIIALNSGIENQCLIPIICK